MEAMMSGLPIVASAVGDLGDLVEDGVNGRLIPPGAAAAFADAIVAILSDPPRLAAMGRAARLAAERYRVEATGATWDRVLAGAGGTRRENDGTCAV
jgi:glycosyltransferase involved in cell wall biosynthesis